MRKVLQDAHSANWFTLDHANRELGTSTGTRPGDPFGDILFNVVAKRILDDIVHELEQQGVATILQPQGERLISWWQADRHKSNDIAYVDDFAFMTLGPSAEGLVSSVERIVATTVAVTTRYGFKLKFGPTKSCAMLVLRGRGSKASRHRIMIEQKAKLTVEDGTGGSIEVPVVREYVHLGCRVYDGASMLAEIRHRMSTTDEAQFGLVARVLRRREIASDSKMSLARALVFSRLLHNAGTWPMLSDAEYKTLHIRMMRVLRPMSSHTVSAPLSDSQVLQEVQAPSLRLALLRLRLQYLARLLQHPCAYLLQLLDVEADNHMSWLQAVKDDLGVMHTSCRKLESMPHPSTDFRAWVELIRLHPRQWTGFVKSTVTHCVASGDLNDPAGGRTINVEAGVPFACHVCDAVCVSAKALRAHAYRVHGIRSSAAGFADTDGVCPVCCWCYHDRSRLVFHLRHDSRPCLAHLVDHFTPFHPDLVKLMDRSDTQAKMANQSKGRHCRFADLPAFRMPGPRFEGVIAH